MQQSRRRDPFTDDLQNLQFRLQKLEILAKIIIGDRWVARDQGVPAGVALEKLSVEGRATARLYHCLSQCCPIAAIDHAHTAIMSLGTKMLAGEDTTDGAASTSMVTECHMAIKSTARENGGLIWLKVKSIMAWEQLEIEDAEAQGESLTPTAGVGEFRAPNQGKRKRSPSPDGDNTGPLPKAPRYEAPRPPLLSEALAVAPATSPPPFFRRTSDSNTEVSSGSWYPVREVRVCPACLAPNADVEDGLLGRSAVAAAATAAAAAAAGPRARRLDHPVMHLEHGDGSQCQHQLFYLPSGQRPAADAPRWSLGQVLEERARQRHLFGRRGWVARVARLVAESVLRFDWRDAQRGPRVENLVFYESTKTTAEAAPSSPSSPSASFEPFLEVHFDSRSSASAAAGDVMAMGQGGMLGSRQRVLLNLGQVLLELGSPAGGLGVSTMGWNVVKHRDFLNKLSRQDVATSRGMGEEYARVIRRCANFDIPTLEEDGNVINEEEFQESYFTHIVRPLRKLEDEFPEDTQGKT
jgi:hypothetical protein